MDTSIRFYTANSRWGSSTEDESQGNRAIPLSADEHSGEGLVDKDGENGEISCSEPSAITQPEHVNIADFESIFLRYQSPITNFIYHMIGNREQACDLAQDVFVKAYKALLGGTIVQPGALSAWLYRIAANTTTDTLRRRRLISWLPMSLFSEDRGIGAGVLSDSGGAASDGFSANNEDGSSDGRSSSISSLYERAGYDGGLFENRVADREIVERIFR